MHIKKLIHLHHCTLYLKYIFKVVAFVMHTLTQTTNNEWDKNKKVKIEKFLAALPHFLTQLSLLKLWSRLLFVWRETKKKLKKRKILSTICSCFSIFSHFKIQLLNEKCFPIIMRYFIYILFYFIYSYFLYLLKYRILTLYFVSFCFI